LQNNDRKDIEFDQFAPLYSELLNDPLRNCFTRDPIHFHRRKWILLERLLESVGAKPETMKWLDVGCGRGELLELGGKAFYQATGCDPSQSMLSLTNRYKTHTQSSPVELPFPDSSFDFVTAVCVLHHVHGEDRTLLMKEIRRVLIHRGFVCIIEHNPWNPVTRVIVKRCSIDVDAELLTARKASTLLAVSGFTTVRKEYFLYLPERYYNSWGASERVLSMLPFGGQYALLSHVQK